MINDKTLEDKIYRVLLIHGQNSKEIAKMIRKEIEVLKEKYKQEIESNKKEYIKAYKYQDTFKMDNLLGYETALTKIIKDLEKLLK